MRVVQKNLSPIFSDIISKVDLRLFHRKFLAGFSWNLVATLALQGSVLLTNIVVARSLDLDAFGLYGLLVSTIMTVANVAQAGIGLVAIKFAGEFLHSDRQRLGRVLRMCRAFTAISGMLATLLLVGLAPLIATQVLHKPFIGGYIKLIAVAVFFQVIVVYQYGALQGFGSFEIIGKSSLLAGLAYFTLAVAGAKLGGLNGSLIGFVLASASRAGIFSLALKKVCHRYNIVVQNKILGEDWKLISDFALPASLSGFVTTASLWIVTAMVARDANGLALAALFSAAQQVRLTALQLPTMLNSTSFSFLSQFKGSRNSTGFHSIFWMSLGLGLVFVTLATLGLSLNARRIMSIFGTRFMIGSTILIVLLVSIIPEFIANTLHQLVQSHGRMWQSLFIVVFPRDIGYVFLAFGLFSWKSLFGVCLAYLITRVAGVFLSMALVDIRKISL